MEQLLTDDKRTWMQLMLAADAPRVDQLRALREHNEKVSRHALKVLHEVSGPVLVEKLRNEKYTSVYGHLEQLKSMRRRKLDSVRAGHLKTAKTIPAERKNILQEERLEVEKLDEARVKLQELEGNLEKLLSESQENFDRLEAKIGEQKRRRRDLDHEMTKAEAEAIATGREGDATRRAAVREELSTVKRQLAESEAQLALLRKHVLEGPRKELTEQQARIEHMEKEQHRNVESIRKRRKKLEDQLKEAQEACADVDEKRINVEVEFRRELFELLAFDRRAVEEALLGALLQRLRAIAPASLRRYASGQELVVRLREGGATAWYDAIVETASPWSFDHRLQLSDGRHVSLMLHPFNHSIQHLPCDAWQELLDRYGQMTRKAHDTLRDPLSGAYRSVLEHFVPLERAGGEAAASWHTHDVSEMIHRAYAAGVECDDGAYYPAPACALLTAPPGAGKSCVLRQLAIFALDQQVLVPIVVRVADMVQRLGDIAHRQRFASAWNYVDAYLQCLSSERPEWAAFYPFLRQAMMLRRALLLIDGVDEGGRATAQIQKHVIDVLAAQGHSIICTSRPPAAAAASQWPAAFTHVRVLPLPAAAQHDVARRRLGTDAAAEALLAYAEAHLPRDTTTQECITQSPLILVMLVSLFERGAEPGMPATISDLYKDISSTVLERFCSEGVRKLIMEVLHVAAFHAHALRDRVITATRLDHAARVAVPASDVEVVVAAIADLVCQESFPLLTLVQAEPLQFQFAHLTFQEYFFVFEACKGCPLPRGMEPPWKWSRWWETALTVGISVGDAFSAGLLAGCRSFEADPVHLDLTKKIGAHLQAPLLPSAGSLSSSSARPSLKRGKTAKAVQKMLADSATSSATADKALLASVGDRSIPIRAVAELMKSCHSLNLQRNALVEADVKSLVVGVRPKTLTALDVSHNQLGNQGMKTLVIALVADGADGALQTLQCSHNGIGADGATAVAHLISTSASLKMLEIRGNDLADEGLAALGRALLQSQRCPLSFVRCDAFDLSDGVESTRLRPFLDATSTLTFAAGVLKWNTVLHELIVCDASIGIEAASSMASAMHLQHTLTSLSLLHTHLGDAAVEALSHGFEAHRGLRKLVLDDCDFGPKGAEALAASIRGCSALGELSVRNNVIRDQGVHVIAEVAGTLASLHSLDLSMTSPSTEGLKSLAALVRRSASLTLVDVTSNDFGGEAMRAMGSAMLKSPQSKLHHVRCE